MKARKGEVTFRGQAMTLLGPKLKEGDKAPEAVLTDPAMQDIHLSSFAGKVRVLSAVPSLDTSVCSLETRRFEQEAARLGSEIVVITVSLDLPFAQKRWAQESGIQHIHLLSDYKKRQFAEKYGVMIDELQLLGRTIFVVDAGGTIRYIERVSEVTHEPNYDAALEAAKGLVAHV